MVDMEFLSNLSDDQFALVGCATALVTTGSLMCLSYFVGRGRTQYVGQTAPTSAVAQLSEAAITGTAQETKHRSAA
jgi:hypothetical protein